MQDGYVGDIRDFVKYGLLRWLCTPGPERAPPPKLGVVWYRVKGVEVDKRDKGGGGGIDCYLWPQCKRCRDHVFCNALRACDPELARLLEPIRANPKRTVIGVEKADILPKSSSFHHDFWALASHGRKPEAPEIRRCIYQKALKDVDHCGIVFLDPDNGIHPGALRNTTLPEKLKHVLWSEANGFCDKGTRTLVLIQFLSQWRNVGTRAQQIGKRRRNLCCALGLSKTREKHIRTALFCFRRCSGGAQPNPKNGPPLVFFVVPGKDHDEFIDARLKALVDEKSPWSRFFSLGGGDRPRGGCPDPGGPCDACDA